MAIRIFILMNYETTSEIEMAVAAHFGWRQHIIVPNISWGAKIHECDVFVLAKSGWATEVEIKISAADLKKDALKRHGHVSDKIKNLYFAIPKKLLKYWRHIPARAGVFVIDQKGRVHCLRQPVKNATARKLTEKEIANIARLGVMRYWSGRNGVLANADDLNRLKQMLGPEHQKKVNSVRHYREYLKDLEREDVAKRDQHWHWLRKHYRKELIQAVENL